MKASARGLTFFNTIPGDENLLIVFGIPVAKWEPFDCFKWLKKEMEIKAKKVYLKWAWKYGWRNITEADPLLVGVWIGLL